METYLLFIVFFAVNPISCVIMLFLEVELKDKNFIKTYNSQGIIYSSRYQTGVYDYGTCFLWLFF